MACSCTPDALGADCAYLVGCLNGVAKRRADMYAAESRWPFPTSSEIRSTAVERCADLAECARVRAELADVFGGWATLQLAARSLRRAVRSAASRDPH